MELIWFGIAAVVVALYVVLDGFDLGAGALHLIVARSNGERRQVLRAIGPFWDGNEVWLLAGGGVLFLAFPKVLASGLSGLYLAIMLVLWVLILRGIAIEFRSHLPDPLWAAFWDGTFWLASTLGPVLFGAALGNLLRGVPMGEDGWFTLPLFGSFSPWGELGVLDWYTVLAGVFALVAIAHHGALFLAWKTDGPVRDRATRQAAWLFPVTLGLWVIASGATWFVAPVVPEGLATRPLAWICTLLAIAGFATSGVARRAAQAPTAFLGSAAFLLGLLAATAVSVYPVMIYAANEPALSLTAVNAASSPHALRVGLLWWPAGALLAIGYFALLLYLHRGVVSVDDGDGY